MKAYYKGRVLSSERIWFENYENGKEISSNADNVVIHANPSPLHGENMNCNEQESLVHSLRVGVDEIFKRFSSTTKNEIRRAEREGVNVTFYTSEDINSDDGVLARMALLYTNMYAEKGMNGKKLPIKELLAYAKNGCLLISVASIDGAETVFHSYVVHEEKSRLLHSCSEFRVAGNAMRNAIGRANKYLHFKDMEYLASLGVDSYDWGGCSSLTEPNGIDKFKMSFGGDPVKYYNIRCANSLKQKLFDRIFR